MTTPPSIGMQRGFEPNCILRLWFSLSHLSKVEETQHLAQTAHPFFLGFQKDGSERMGSPLVFLRVGIGGPDFFFWGGRIKQKSRMGRRTQPVSWLVRGCGKHGRRFSNFKIHSFEDLGPTTLSKKSIAEPPLRRMETQDEAASKYAIRAGLRRKLAKQASSVHTFAKIAKIAKTGGPTTLFG